MKNKYIKKTKAYKFILKLYKTLTQKIYPTALICQRIYCLFHREYKLFTGNMVGVVDYLQRKGGNRHCLFSKEPFPVYENVFRGSETECEKPRLVEYPEVYCTEFKNVEVYGGYNYFSDASEIILPIYNKCTLDRVMYTNPLLRVHIKSRGILRYRNVQKAAISKAIFMCGCAGGNYYHFMAEVLPKLVLIEKEKLFPGYSILTDQVIRDIPSLRDALNLVNITKRDIIFVNDMTSQSVDSLAYVANVSLQPMNLKIGVKAIDEDFAFSYRSLQCMKDIIKRNIQKTNAEKIYLARFGMKGVRGRLNNDEQIAGLCQKAGFKIIFPERLGFIEQVSLFMGAKYIMGCGGAALTNVMFCEADTTVYIITSKEHSHNLWYTYAKNFNLNPVLIDTVTVYREEYDTGNVLKVDENTIIQILNEIDIAKPVKG